MKKFEQINKHMDANKIKPIQEIIVIDFLPVSKFLYHNNKSYDHKTIVNFFEDNHIILKNFYRGGEFDKECKTCGKKNWLVWQNEFMYYDTRNKCFIKTEDDEELEGSPELEEIDFAVYVCLKCGAWLTDISEGYSFDME